VPIRNEPLEIPKFACPRESSERVGAVWGPRGHVRPHGSGLDGSRRDLARPEKEPVLPRPSFDLTAIGVDTPSVGATKNIESCIVSFSDELFLMQSYALY